jgi:hypothetical protein
MNSDRNGSKSLVTWVTCALRLLPVLLGGAIGTLIEVPLTAHDAHVVGPYRLEIGWGDEPAFTGIRNSVIVEVTDAKSGGGITDLAGSSLSVEIIYGNERTVMALQPQWNRRNELRAWLIPTRAGTYTFHLTGTLKSHPVDITTTCSEKTYDCVVDAAEIQFPAKDPSGAQLADRMARSLPRADRAAEVAARTQTIAFIALIASAVAFATAVGVGIRRRKGA